MKHFLEAYASTSNSAFFNLHVHAHLTQSTCSFPVASYGKKVSLIAPFSICTEVKVVVVFDALLSGLPFHKENFAGYGHFFMLGDDLLYGFVFLQFSNILFLFFDLLIIAYKRLFK